MTWMRLPGQGWPGMAVTFMGMWAVMMVAMMLPTVVPMLLRYRDALGADARAAVLTLCVAAAYFGVWILAGVPAFASGVLFAELSMRVPAVARVVPLLSAAAIVLVGTLQISPWKARQLVCCRDPIDRRRPPDRSDLAAWRQGFDLGLRCLRCCAPLTALLLVLGVMELWAMALVTAAISIERLSSRGDWAARAIGVGLLVWGVWCVLQALAPDPSAVSSTLEPFASGPSG